MTKTPISKSKWGLMFGKALKHWQQLGLFLGAINTRLVLTVFFIFIFTPVGIYRRLRKKDTLGLKLDQGLSTYLTENSRVYNKQSMERSF